MDFKEFRYPKPKRFNIGKRMGNKCYLKPADESFLLAGRVIVEEKMEGSQVNARNKRFIFSAIDLTTARSTIYNAPGRFAVFDIFSLMRGTFLGGDEKEEEMRFLMKNRDLLPQMLSDGGAFLVQRISTGTLEKNDLPNLITLSYYASHPGRDPAFMEGIVVKPDRELFYEEHLSGKIIRHEFLNGTEKQL